VGRWLGSTSDVGGFVRLLIRDGISVRPNIVEPAPKTVRALPKSLEQPGKTRIGVLVGQTEHNR
jgi:hypothetical protein